MFSIVLETVTVFAMVSIAAAKHHQQKELGEEKSSKEVRWVSNPRQEPRGERDAPWLVPYGLISLLLYYSGKRDQKWPHSQGAGPFDINHLSSVFSIILSTS